MANRPFLDPNDPFFRSPIVRWITVLLPLFWGVVELWSGNPGWGVMFLAAGGYAGWKLFLNAGDK